MYKLRIVRASVSISIMRILGGSSLFILSVLVLLMDFELNRRKQILDEILKIGSCHLV